MSGLGDDALRTAVLKTLSDDIGDTITGGKAGLRDAMTEAGAEKAPARLPDGTKVASVLLVGGEPAPRITDPAAFEAWVRQNRPDETEVIVRESYRKAVLEDARKAGRAVDRATGDIVPGISFERTTPYLRVVFTTGDTGGRELIRRAWRDGVIDLPKVLELPAGEAPGAA